MTTIRGSLTLANINDGAVGATGATGATGSTGPTAQWYYGTALTHTSGTATLATSSTAGVVVGAMYLNKDTSLCYKCTAISGTTATWTYAGNLTDGVIENIANTFATKAELNVESERITSSVEELNDSVTVNSSAIEQNAESISSVVAGLGQSSHFIQTATGFEFSIDSAIEDAARTATDFLSYDSTTGELTLAKSNSEISQVLTNERNAFRTSAGDMLWVGRNSENDTWEVHSEILFAEDMVRFGNYAFIKRQNGNMSLKWLGE